MRRTRPLIVGGGPAGAAAAIALARAGTPATLLERHREQQDALCGGFLSWATLDRLATLGVEARTLGAHRVDRLALYAGTHTAEARLPAAAAGLSRAVLDTALLAQATALGTGVERGVAVKAWEDGTLRLADGGTLAPERLLLATGKHDLRGLARPRGATLGLRFRLAASPVLDRLLDGRIELHLFRGGYAGLVRQEDGANLCLATDARRLADAEGRPDRLLAAIAREVPPLADRLAAARSIGPAQAIANVPYGWRTGTTRPGIFRIGDQAGVIPSLAGEGIDIALATGLAAAAAMGRGDGSETYQRQMVRDLARPITLAGAAWRTAEHPLGARAMIAAVTAAPALAALVARLTRVR